MTYISTFFAKFSKDTSKRLRALTEADLYEAQLDVMKATQQKLYIDAILEYNTKRAEALAIMVKTMKGQEDVKTTSSGITPSWSTVTTK